MAQLQVMQQHVQIGASARVVGHSVHEAGLRAPREGPGQQVEGSAGAGGKDALVLRWRRIEEVEGAGPGRRYVVVASCGGGVVVAA